MMVPKERLELSRYHYRRILSPLRLPFRHLGTKIKNILALTCFQLKKSRTRFILGIYYLYQTQKSYKHKKGIKQQNVSVDIMSLGILRGLHFSDTPRPIFDRSSNSK